MEFFEKALTIQREKSKNSDNGVIAETYYQIGSLLHQKSLFKPSLQHFERAYVIFDELQDLNWKALCKNAIGSLNQTLGNYELAFEYYNQSREILESLGNIQDNSRLAHTISLMGDIYYKKSNYKKALECYETAVATKKKILRTEEHKDFIKIFLNIGKLFNLKSELSFKFFIHF